jgi:hypothetical protein
MTEIITHEDIDGAIAELSAAIGVDPALIRNAVTDLAPGGMGDELSLSAGLNELLAELDNAGIDRSSLMPPGWEEHPASGYEQDVALSQAYAQNDPAGTYLSVTQAERDAAHAEGNSLPDKSYPIRNVKQLHSAATLAASHHGDWKAAQKLIRRRAKELGVDVNTLPGFGDGDSDDLAATSPYRRRHLPPGSTIALSDSDYGEYGNPADPPLDPADTALVAAHRRAIAAGPGFKKHFEKMFHLNPESGISLAAGDDDGDSADSEINRIVGRNPSMFASGGDGKGHTSACDPDCTQDHAQPKLGGQIHPEVQKYLDMAADKFGKGARENPHGANVSYPPGSYREPGPSGRPQSDGGTSW